MKAFGTFLKILTALAAIAGAIYVVATYGDKIVAWAKDMLETCKCFCEDNCKCRCSCKEDVVEAEPAEEAQEQPEEGAATEADFEA